MNKLYLASYLKAGRKSRGLGQRAFAEKLSVTPSYISKIETLATDKPPSVKLIRAIAQEFGDEPDHILAECGLVDVAALRQRVRDSYWIALLLNRIASGAVTADDLVDMGVFAPERESA